MLTDTPWLPSGYGSQCLLKMNSMQNTHGPSDVPTVRIPGAKPVICDTSARMEAYLAVLQAPHCAYCRTTYSRYSLEMPRSSPHVRCPARLNFNITNDADIHALGGFMSRTRSKTSGSRQRSTRNLDD
jgi:hypothetical protein